MKITNTGAWKRRSIYQFGGFGEVDVYGDEPAMVFDIRTRPVDSDEEWDDIPYTSFNVRHSVKRRDAAIEFAKHSGWYFTT